MTDYLLKCRKCGAVMIREDYHLYGWYLDSKRVERCPRDCGDVKVRQEDLRSIPAAKKGQNRDE